MGIGAVPRMLDRERTRGHPWHRDAKPGDRVFLKVGDDVATLVQPIAVLDVECQLARLQRFQPLDHRIVAPRTTAQARQPEPAEHGDEHHRWDQDAPPVRAAREQHHEHDPDQGAQPEAAAVGEGQLDHRQRRERPHPQRQADAPQRRRDQHQQHEHVEPVGRRFYVGRGVAVDQVTPPGKRQPQAD